MRIAGFALVPALVAAGSCSTSGRARFEAEIAPELERRCLGSVCHGVAPDAEARGETIDWSHFMVRTSKDGRITDMDAAYRTVKARINTTERPELSTLLRKPLAREGGGVPHLGGVAWASRDHAGYRALLAWIASESGGGEGRRIEDLSPLEQQFARGVLPLLATRQCMNAACHGSTSPFTAFEPPMNLDGDLVFSVEAIRKNYAAARSHLYLAGYSTLSRFVRKTLPLDAGGIFHRGGNDIFFRWGSMTAPIEGWIEAERANAMGSAEPGVRGFVFVRGPLASEGPFEPGAFVPGSDLWVIDGLGGAPRNLTEFARSGPADVRDPAVSHDATRIVFSMKTGLADGFNLYEIGVDGAGFRQLTHDAQGANVQPTYGPDGRVYFVSSRANQLADGGALDTDIWAVDPNGSLERLTHDPSPESTPTFFAIGKPHGTLAFTVLRGIGGAFKGAVFRTPLDHNPLFHGDPELHIHHGLTLPSEIAYAARELPDGRMTFVALDRSSMWRAGPLAIVDRQLGPLVAPGHEDEVSLPSHRDALAVLDAGALYRHPVALPDGRILVSVSPIAEPPVFRLVALSIEEDRVTGAPRIVRVEPIADGAVSQHDGEPIAARPLEDDPTHALAWSPGAATGRLAYRHVETLEAILNHLEPRGPRPPRTDLAFARLIEAQPLTPADLSAGPVSMGSYGRARILAEVPLAGGSLNLEVPASTPFRIQFLDADRMAVGAQHNRWIEVAPGQTFPGGVDLALYPTLCSGCHGSLSGNPSATGGPVPDVVTRASVTLATHDGMDPRRPLAPLRVGDGRIEIDFRRDILGLVARSCAGCHSGPSPAGSLDLVPRPTTSYDTTYEALHARVIESNAFASELIERIYGRELGAARPLDGICRGAPPLSDDERLAVVRWIDLGAVYRGAR